MFGRPDGWVKVENPPIPDAEMQAYQLRRTLYELTGHSASEFKGYDTAGRFRYDFLTLAHAITDPDWHKPPKPHKNPNLPPFRTYPIPRRLPFGPLRRMAKLIGPQALRYLFDVGSESGAEFFRLELRRRLDKEFRDGNHHKQYGHELDLIRFGNAVLQLEQNSGLRRSESLEAAAQRLDMAASRRTLERHFREFRKLCQRLGYVRHPSEWSKAVPQFSLRDLDARAPDKPER